MSNPFAGEVTITLNGAAQRAKLTLGALAELEAALGEDSLLALVERFEAGRFSSRDVLALVVAGLRGGGWQGKPADLIAADSANDAYFTPSATAGHAMFDLNRYTIDRLKRAGVTVDHVARCTYAEADNFFSYRRTTHRQEPDYGRQLSAIVLET
ncbi:MAG: GTA-gp10 family protein, partial [Aliihoeflea sp.]